MEPTGKLLTGLCTVTINKSPRYLAEATITYIIELSNNNYKAMA